MKNFFKRIIKNIKIFALAILITLIIFFILKNPGFFKASILLLEDRQMMIDNQWDVGYKNTSGILDVFLSDQIKDFNNLVFSISFDPQSINVDTNTITTQGKYEIKNIHDGEFQIKIIPTTGIDYNQSLFMLPFSGDTSYILLSEGFVTLKDNQIQSLAIGNLNEGKNKHQ